MRTRLAALALAVALAPAPALAQSPAATPRAAEPAPIRDLRIDPLTFASAVEYRHIIATLGPRLFPGWDAHSVPMLLYRPRVQEVLLGARRRPPGFARYAGPSPFGAEPVWARNDSTVMDIDGQNTRTQLDSAEVLVVADRWSRAREQLRGMLSRPAPLANEWLDRWNFIPSPYDEVEIMLHEAFHVHQFRLAPAKGADEGGIARYPLLSPANNALFSIEGLVLRDALRSRDPAVRRAKARAFVAVRLERRAALDTGSAGYEDLNEYTEGLGRYVEWRFLQLGETLTPTPGMFQQAGFTGYGDVLRRRFERQLDDMVKLTANSDDRFGNRFGGGPLRFRLYVLGAAQGLLLDDLAPAWKRHIFEPGASLTGLLAAAVAMSEAERRALLDTTLRAYGHAAALTTAQAFEREGRAAIQRKVDAIVQTTRTLVQVRYAAAGDRLGMGYTPFGVTAVTSQSAIYDLVPVALRFGNRVLLQMKSVIPLLLDRGAHTVTFAVDSPPAAIAEAVARGIDVAEFSLGAAPGATAQVEGNRVTITFP
ncbi:MAG: hypothetical protein HYX65_01380 [Gemmatimonadetes bacterium]|nr:hypothetical protein [Gemmatimonadota bacterium]